LYSIGGKIVDIPFEKLIVMRMVVIAKEQRAVAASLSIQKLQYEIITKSTDGMI
jgi:hypothetical protein